MFSFMVSFGQVYGHLFFFDFLKLGVGHVGFNNVVAYVVDKSLIFIVPFMENPSDLDEVLAMQSCAYVCYFVSKFVAFEVGCCGDAIIDVLLGGVAAETIGTTGGQNNLSGRRLGLFCATGSSYSNVTGDR